MEHLNLNFAVVLVLFFFLFGIDDFFIDICAAIFSAKPEEIPMKDLEYLQSVPQKRIAVLVAAWKEEGVLKQMIRGNTSSILYKNYTFFLGAYPNDLGTLEEAKSICADFENVHLVVNPLEGPTCKGQMLNVLIRGIFDWERKSGQKFDAFVIHDSEDLIHPHEFTILNKDLEKYDFVQTPVYSLPVSPFAWVAGTYIDEFAESHSRTVLVRNRMGAAIPSAGVGTAVSRKLVLRYLEKQSGNLLNTNSLTEDYELGLNTKKEKFFSKFSCYYFTYLRRRKEYIATREYFPKGFWASIRQKSRWTLGIAFQGTENLGWKGDIVDLYFLFRDRKGPFCNLLSAIALLFFLSNLRALWTHTSELYLLEKEIIFGVQVWFLMKVNLVFMVNRVLQRGYCVYQIYGWRQAILSPVRWPIANLINFLATYQAVRQYIQSKVSGVQPKWIKTDHELPLGFGVARDELLNKS